MPFDQADSRRPPSTVAGVQSQVSPFEICYGPSGFGTDFSTGTSFSSINIIPAKPHNRLHLHSALTRKTKMDEASEPSKNQRSFANRRELNKKVLPLSV
jgi:hypothetical protein